MKLLSSVVEAIRGITRKGTRKKPERNAFLEKLYAKLPKMECKGLCTDSCGPIPYFLIEAQNIEARTGVKTLVTDKQGTCSQLKKGRCSIYEERPAICRLWGMVDHPMMKCPHGCKPDRYLTNDEVNNIFESLGFASTGRMVVAKMPKSVESQVKSIIEERKERRETTGF